MKGGETVNKMMSVPVIGIVLVCLIASFVTAFEGIPDSPLYTIRMEQASIKMHFMPGENQEYTYIAEQGYELPYNIVYGGSVIPLSTALDTDCLNTCGGTCSTCFATCGTCECTCPVGCYIGETSEPDCTIHVKVTAFMEGC